MKWLVLITLLGIIGVILFGNLDAMDAGNLSNNVLYVGGSGFGNYTTIQSAIQSATNGSRIIIYPGVYHEHLVVDKLVSLIGVSSVIIDGDNTGNVIHLIADNAVIENLTIKNSGVPSIEEPSHNMSDNTTKETKDGGGKGISGSGKFLKILNQSINYAGIFIESDNVTVSNCNIYSCHLGIILRNGSHASFENCHTYNSSTGIEIINSSDDRIFSCNSSYNINGFLLYYTNESEIFGCNFFSNRGVGISLNRVLYTIFHYNIVDKNVIGIILANKCIGNIFYQNNFIGNLNIDAMDNCNNSWDNGIHGNYWSDYTGTDANGDGIGDTPYNVPLVSTDYYPIMKPVSIEGAWISLKILSPQEGDYLEGTITIEGTVASKASIKEVKIRIDNETWMLANGTSSWEAKIDTTKYQNGYHHIYAFAVNSDNISTISHLKIYIDNPQTTNNKTPGFGIAIIFISIFLFILRYRFHSEI